MKVPAAVEVAVLFAGRQAALIASSLLVQIAVCEGVAVAGLGKIEAVVVLERVEELMAFPARHWDDIQTDCAYRHIRSGHSELDSLAAGAGSTCLVDEYHSANLVVNQSASVVCLPDAGKECYLALVAMPMKHALCAQKWMGSGGVVVDCVRGACGLLAEAWPYPHPRHRRLPDLQSQTGLCVRGQRHTIRQMSISRDRRRRVQTYDRRPIVSSISPDEYS